MPTGLLLMTLLSLVTGPALPQNKVTDKNSATPVVKHWFKEALTVGFELDVPALGINDSEQMGSGPYLYLLLEKKNASDPIVKLYGDYYGLVHAQPVHRLSELRGKVHITSPEAALSFVRLPTSPQIFDVFNRREEPGSKELEVICSETDIPKVTFGLHRRPWRPTFPPPEKAVSSPEGQYALISAATAKKLGIHFAQVQVSGTGYEVERLLLVKTLAGSMQQQKKAVPAELDRLAEWNLLYSTHASVYLVKTVEWVGPDGEYRIEKNEKVVVPDDPGVKWRFPVFYPGR